MRCASNVVEVGVVEIETHLSEVPDGGLEYATLPLNQDFSAAESLVLILDVTGY